MKTATIIKFSALGVTAFLLVFGISYWISTSNKEIEIRNGFTAAKKERETSLDNMWKKISQKYQLNNQYASDFKNIIELSVQGREGGQLLKFTKEAYPQLSTELYKDVMATIDGERDNLKRSQDRLADIQREHNNLLMKFPSSIVVGSREPITYTIVSSTKTIEILNTGKEDDIDLNKK